MRGSSGVLHCYFVRTTAWFPESLIQWVPSQGAGLLGASRLQKMTLALTTPFMYLGTGTLPDRQIPDMKELLEFTKTEADSTPAGVLVNIANASSLFAQMAMGIILFAE